MQGCRMNRSIDHENSSEDCEHLCTVSRKEIKKNIKHIKEALQTPEVYKTLLYFTMCGMFVPTYTDIDYYFRLVVLEFS